MAVNPLRWLRNHINDYLCMRAMQGAGRDICDDMRKRLTAPKPRHPQGHVDTGALLASIRYTVEKQDDGTILLKVYADAQDNGVYYAEFIEYGSGAAHGREGGRVGTWHYKDRNGNWHTTDGMDADPFIIPSVEENLPRIAKYLRDYIVDIAKYQGGSSE